MTKFEKYDALWAQSYEHFLEAWHKWQECGSFSDCNLARFWENAMREFDKKKRNLLVGE